MPSTVRLKINFNNTVKARWDARLGYQNISSPLLRSLSAIHEEGGVIGGLYVLLVRVYPMVYYEETNNGKGKTC